MTSKRTSPSVWFLNSIAVGITMFLVGGIFHVLSLYFASGLEQQYKNRDLFRNWEEWTSTYMMIHPFLFAPVFTFVYVMLRWKTAWLSGSRGGFFYGAGVFGAGSLPVFLLALASFQVSLEIMMIWIAQNLCQYLAAGVVLGAVTDGAIVRCSVRLSASADDAWERLLQKETFLQIINGWLTVINSETWPATLFRPGTNFVMLIRLLGIGPVSSHTVNVIRVDYATKEIETEENGTLVSTWNHHMRVEAVSDRQCRYTDCIHLNAGLLTPVVWLFSRLFYRARQQQLQLLFANPRSCADA